MTQTAPYYRARLDILLRDDDNHHYAESLEVDGARTEIQIPANFRVTQVLLDPHFHVLHWTPEFHSESDALVQVTRARFERLEGKKAKATIDFEAALAAVKTPDTWGVTFRAEGELGRIAMSDQQWPDAKTHFMAALSAPVRPEDELPVVFLRLATVAQRLNDPSLLHWAISGAVTADSQLANRTGAGHAALALTPLSSGTPQ